MNINDIVEIHDELNPKLWYDNNLRREVEYKLLQIAMAFIKFINLPNLRLVDVTVSGSNASYNYNQNSDIDLHLVVDESSECIDELKELYPDMNDSKESYIDHVKQLARRIDGTVLCTDGAKVAYATNQIDLLEIVPPTIAGANNVGAGDASLAGYLAAESSGSDFATAISTAMSWASAACQNPGTAGLNLKAAKGAPATITKLS